MARACWFARTLDGIGPCEGRMDRAHLIKAQVIRKELRDAVGKCPDCGAAPGEVCVSVRKDRLPGALRQPHANRSAILRGLIWDERVWVWSCRRHHAMLDHSRQIRLPRGMLPASVEEFAREHGMTHWLEREYGGGPWEQAA